MTIFVSVAAYRDPELIPTLLDCVRRARYPADLRFGVCWQHGDNEPAPPDLGPAQMRLLDVPWRESQGACWARAEIMKLWEGEDYFFQIDSHHRFVKGWDALLLDQAERTGDTRPLLTTYATAYRPDQKKLPPGHPTRMKIAGFTPEGVPMFDSEAMPEVPADLRPMRARCLSGHLLFTLGRFVEDVPYDPDLYFYGEEPNLALRAFTHGYSLYHPAVHVMWHQWPRRVTPMHWDDHVRQQGVIVTAQQRDVASKRKVARLLTHPQIGPFGCGVARTAAEYEAYAGVNFRRRHISPEARLGHEPPPPPSPVEGPGGVRTWPVRLELDRSTIAPGALDRPAFWYVAFHDADGKEIARQDAAATELHRILTQTRETIVIERQVRAPRPPVQWTVWPTDRRRAWLDRLTGPIDAASFAVQAT
jgi:hypothetical protein